MAAKLVERECPVCGGTFESAYRGRDLLICGAAECVSAHNDMAEARRRAPRPRRERSQPRGLYGDFAWVAVVNGISTDGTGRVVR